MTKKKLNTKSKTDFNYKYLLYDANYMIKKNINILNGITPNPKNTLINTIPKEVIQKQCAHQTQIAI